MLPLVDADREEARYQQLAESYKSEARTIASSRSRAYDIAPSFRSALSQFRLEETALGSTLEQDAVGGALSFILLPACVALSPRNTATELFRLTTYHP